MAKWVPLDNGCPLGDQVQMWLLTDGTVLCHEFQSKKCARLTPDKFGDYVKGTWKDAASMKTARGYYASAVLLDGRVFVYGGEYDGSGNDVNLPNAEIYDPVQDVWTSIPSITFANWSNLGDAPSCALPNGKVIIGDNSGQSAIYDPTTNSWALAGRRNGGGATEESWALLQSGQVFTVNNSSVVSSTGMNNTEIYDPKTNAWRTAAPTSVKLVQGLPSDKDLSLEIGPVILLPNGSVFVVGATGNTAIFTPPAKLGGTGTWANGPGFPNIDGSPGGAKDGPACLLPNGRVLCSAGPCPSGGDYDDPTIFFEFDPSRNTLTRMPDADDTGNSPTYEYRMLLIPSGQVLLSDSDGNIQVYLPDAASSSSLDSLKPVITDYPKVSVGPGETIQVSGKNFNGFSQAVGYGDDAMAATNYPLAFVRNPQTNTKKFCRTFNHSSLGVGKTGDPAGNPGSTNIEINGSVDAGHQQLVIVVNGIESSPVTLTIPGMAVLWESASPLVGWNRSPDDIFTAADIDGDGKVELIVTNNKDRWTGVLKWNGSALVPIWMSPSPIGGWNRGTDVFVAADVDGDRKAEILIANNKDGWTGVLKWNGSALVPIWMSPSPLAGWNRGNDTFIAADVDGDGKVELVVAADNHAHWTGVLKWNGSALVPIWMSASPLGGWNRSSDDQLIAADVDGDRKTEILIVNNKDHWTGVLKWNGSALLPVWMSPSPLGGWNRGIDTFTPADLDCDGKIEILIANNKHHWTGVLKWNGSALAPIWMSPSPIGGWKRGSDVFIAADVDCDGYIEVLVANNDNGWTGVLKWSGSELYPVWMSPNPVGAWNRGNDTFTAGDLDGDGFVEIVTAANNHGRWTGVWKWIR
jgi:hypothetical protein